MPLHCVSLLLFVAERVNRMRVLVGIDFFNISLSYLGRVVSLHCISHDEGQIPH